MQDLATHPLMQAAKAEFVAFYVAAMDGVMTTVDASSDAEEAFGRMLSVYFAEAANFDPASPYIDAVEHAGNECRGGNELEQDAVDAICEAHFNISREKPAMKEAA